jgi:hypothetical protein
MTTFGFNGLNRGSDAKNSFNSNTSQATTNLITPVRVLSIILDETHPLFSYLGGWNALGTIQYEIVSQPEIRIFNEGNKDIPRALPATPNLKNYPLINEIVYIISLPNTGIGDDNNLSISYYLNLTSLWNHPHHNAYPSIANEPSPPQQKDYSQTIAGSIVTTVNDPNKIFLGKTFKERSNIHPLLPFEGDVIHEGRWGNSIRLGSTVSGTPNAWSSTGEDGDPITIIRNGQGNQTKEGWIPITESTTDDSSIYLTSTQNIPIFASSVSYISYPDGQQPISPDKYDGNQIILNSGRLVFNTTSDHLLLSSVKSINLNSQESVNIDTKKFITQADQIFLGKEDLATEPLLLGNTTVSLLKDLISALKNLSNTLKITKTSPAVPGSPSTLPSLNLAAVTLSTQLTALEKQLGLSPETCTITSKRNFTL